jgi:hypothetical protein
VEGEQDVDERREKGVVADDVAGCPYHCCCYAIGVDKDLFQADGKPSFHCCKVACPRKRTAGSELLLRLKLYLHRQVRRKMAAVRPRVLVDDKGQTLHQV